MSTEVDTIHVDLDLDDKKFQSGVGRIGHGTGKMDKAFRIAKAGAIALGVAIAAAGVAAVAFGAASVKAYNESLEAQTKLSTNLLNVKGNTEANVKSIEKLAAALQKKGVVEDDAIIAGASQLATFNLQGKTIETLTPKITDMVAQLNGSNATAEDTVAINNLVGKAMMGNVGALSRYGVTLDENQKKLIKEGDESVRAATIVEVLSQNYGAVNEALAKTPQGQMARLRNQFGDLKERVGEVLVKALVPMMSFVMDKVLPALGELWRDMQEPLRTTAEWIKTKLWPALKDLWPVLQRIGKAVIDGIGAAIEFLIPIFQSLYEKWKAWWPSIEAFLRDAWNNVLKPIFDAVVKAVQLIWRIFQDAWPAIQVILQVAGVIIGVVLMAIYWTIKNVVVPVITFLVEAMSVAWTVISTVIGVAWAIIKPIWDVIYAVVANVLIPIFQSLWLIIQIAFAIIWEAIKGAWDIISPIFQSIYNWLADKLAPIWNTMKEAAKAAWEWIEDNIVPIIETVIDAISKAVGWVQNLIDKFNIMKALEGKKTEQAPGQFGEGPVPKGRPVALGGPVTGGRPYLVGEHGPELFMPSRDGRIINNRDTLAMGGGGGTTINMSFDASGIMATSRAHIRDVAATLIEAANEELIGRGYTPIADNKLRAAV